MRKSQSLWKRANYVDCQCVEPDPAVESRSEAALWWANAANRKCTLLIDAKELASRPLGTIRVRECNMAEHERTDRLYVNLVPWTNVQRTKGKHVCIDDKDGASSITRSRLVRTPRRWHSHDQARALEAAKHCRGAVAHLGSNVGHRGFGC